LISKVLQGHESFLVMLMVVLGREFQTLLGLYTALCPSRMNTLHQIPLTQSHLLAEELCPELFIGTA
jgi:hypothetical protein